MKTVFLSTSHDSFMFYSDICLRNFCCCWKTVQPNSTAVSALKFEHLAKYWRPFICISSPIVKLGLQCLLPMEFHSIGLIQNGILYSMTCRFESFLGGALYPQIFPQIQYHLYPWLWNPTTTNKLYSFFLQHQKVLSWNSVTVKSIMGHNFCTSIIWKEMTICHVYD